MLTKVSLASFAPHTSVLTVLDFSSATLASPSTNLVSQGSSYRFA